ncbi:hypothetical protein P872_02095 [Rhodonellum psychrophilum GCM71 = DSM 17998]|uniref:Uncharacterized protein n=1 Tax=Rhodonellum psychrophilum GCM71 = DSM 17998 TaxID=1123057 RepID=U5C4K8_9BACT|nr:hypothetical protein P872_02095 [Rhodonellum psychrophilum GCM71 = DSM 17998]
MASTKSLKRSSFQRLKTFFIRKITRETNF